MARLQALPGEIQQRENLNPQHSHEVPIPRGDVDDNAPRLRWPDQPIGQPRIEQRKTPTHEMDGVNSSENEEERTADIGFNVDVAEAKLTPSEILSAKKRQAQNRSEER